MWRLSGYQMAVFLLLAAMTAGAQVPNSPAQETLSPGVTVTGKAVHSGPPLPKIPPDEFADCVRQQAGMGMSQYAHGGGTGFPDLMTLEACQIQMDWEKNVVFGPASIARPSQIRATAQRPLAIFAQQSVSTLR